MDYALADLWLGSCWEIAVRRSGDLFQTARDLQAKPDRRHANINGRHSNPNASESASLSARRLASALRRIPYGRLSQRLRDRWHLRAVVGSLRVDVVAAAD